VTSGWKKRLMQIVFELEAYQADHNPFGNSITQRFEYWKIASHLFAQHLWLGVGTGDVRRAFDEVYQHYPYAVDPAFRLRAHNQYLTMGVSLGIVGLLVFLVYVFSLLWTRHYKSQPYLTCCSLLIMLLSFVSEDTLETQSGVTFVAFFHTLFHLRSVRPVV
jgi:O-antigen ligase